MSLPLLFANRRLGETAFLAEYTASGGYQGLRQALTLTPRTVTETVKAAGLRGRGGAGFPTGVKWSFFPSQEPGAKYLLCNCDEMEPGTYKDGLLLRCDPHQLVEGMIIAAYALQVPEAFVFIRYAYAEAADNLERAVAEAKNAGYLGENILGSGFSCNIHVHRSAGRYICGEETAQLNSLEGLRPNPRRKPPFPATKGLFGRPTTINNVETLANIQHIITLGAEGWKNLARPGMSGGSKLFGLSGHLNITDCFELPLGVTLGEVVNDYGGGVRGGKKFKACLPGGASTPYLTAGHFDLPLDFDSIAEAGSRLGTAAVTVFDADTCMVAATLNLVRFFARESCGWCTPCRDGLPYLVWLLETIEAGQGSKEHIALLHEQVGAIGGRSFCALAEGALGPVQGLLRHFEEELYDHLGGSCPFGR